MAHRRSQISTSRAVLLGILLVAAFIVVPIGLYFAWFGLVDWLAVRAAVGDAALLEAVGWGLLGMGPPVLVGLIAYLLIKAPSRADR